MLNETLYMEMRLLQQFCQKFQYSAKNANSLFLKYGIWKYIEDCYDSLHMNGDEYIMNDIQEILHARVDEFKEVLEDVLHSSEGHK